MALLPIGRTDRVWEPHVGGGAFARAIERRTPWVMVSDLDPCAPGLKIGSFSSSGADFLDLDWSADWIIGNPPFRDAESHIRHALTLAPNVAFLLRLAMLEGKTRRALWEEHPPAQVWVLAERPSFTGGGTDSAAYGFFWWDREWTRPTELGWVSWRGGR